MAKNLCESMGKDHVFVLSMEQEFDQLNQHFKCKNCDLKETIKLGSTTIKTIDKSIEKTV